jgi:hypothetical protein
MRKILHFRVAGSLRKNNPKPLVIPKPARSARNLLPSEKQQTPRATLSRFGMTILWGFSNYTTRHFRWCNLGDGAVQALDPSIRLELRA